MYMFCGYFLSEVKMLACSLTSRESSPLPVASDSAVSIHNITIITCVICPRVVTTVFRIRRSIGVPVCYRRSCCARAWVCVEIKKDLIYLVEHQLDFGVGLQSLKYQLSRAFMQQGQPKIHSNFSYISTSSPLFEISI